MKDTTDILHKLDAISSALDNTNLVSLDLKSLYIRIPNAEGVKAVKESCDKKKKKKNATTKVLTTFLALILN